MIQNKKILIILVSFLLSLFYVQGAFSDTSYRIKSSDNLNKIADQHYQGSGLTKSQIIVGIYASNPEAFKNGNINKLKRGKKLVLPNAEKISQISEHEAELVLSARKSAKKVKKRKTKKRLKSKRKYKKRPRKKRLRKKRLVTKKATPNNLAVSQANNIQKIDKLEKESESLRKRLDALLAQKSASDNKLKKLEKSLQAILKKTSASTVATVESTVTAESAKSIVKKEPKVLEKKRVSNSELVTQKANEKLRETNTLLEKNLQESKAEMASRTRDSLATRHEVNAGERSRAPEVSNSFDTSNKYLQWALLSILLFPLVWFAKRFIAAKKVKQQPVWATESETQNSVLGAGSEQIDTHYQEAPVEPSIKLDVANAYLEAGNIDEALELLNELLTEGNAEQQAQAQDLLDRYS